jgi:hypothetical protein
MNRVLVPGRNLRIRIVAVITGLLLCSLSARAEYFTIDRFHSEITVSEDASLTVVETIDLTFHQPRHGIYRTIPCSYYDELGKPHRTPIELVSVNDGHGADRSYDVSRSDVLDIRIGDPDTYVNGAQTYVISYRVENAVLFMQGLDEVYWDVTGNEWQAPIGQVSARVTIDTDRSLGELWTSCYTGAYGSSEKDCSATTMDRGAQFACNRPLAEGEGYTVAMGWSKGIVIEPSAWQQAVWDYNLGALWVFLFPIAILGFMIVHWQRHGRDPRVREAVVVTYGPPQVGGVALSAAEVGTMTDERLDPRDITAALVGLAAKGYFKIVEINKPGFIRLFDTTDYDLQKTKEPDAALSTFERLLMEKLFAGGLQTRRCSSLRNEFYKQLPELTRALYNDLMRKGFFVADPRSVRTRYVVIGVGVVVIGVLTGLALTPETRFATMSAGILTGLIIAAFAHAMPAKTRVGATVLMDIRGFQEFMNRADRDRIERLGKAVFYQYLPYAIALDVTDQWAEAFDGLCDQPPDWYVASHAWVGFRTSMFAQSLTHATTSIGQSMHASPRGGRGGSGGRGFSGGGMGGGGGRSW